MTPGSQQPFLKTFAQAFKGRVSQKQMWILSQLKRATFCIFAKNPGQHFLFTPRNDTAGSQFFQYESSTE